MSIVTSLNIGSTTQLNFYLNKPEMIWYSTQTNGELHIEIVLNTMGNSQKTFLGI